jgi:hypothetical protein
MLQTPPKSVGQGVSRQLPSTFKMIQVMLEAFHLTKWSTDVPNVLVEKQEESNWTSL